MYSEDIKDSIKDHIIVEQAIKVSGKSLEELLDIVTISPEYGEAEFPRSWPITYVGRELDKCIDDIRAFIILVWTYSLEANEMTEHLHYAQSYLLKEEYGLAMNLAKQSENGVAKDE